MSDLAPLVAAVLRDKTVADLLEENNQLKRKFAKITTEVNTVKIKTGHGEDEVVYAKGEVDKDGWEQEDGDCPRWMVDLSTTGVQCHYTELLDVQVSIGDTAKDLFECGEIEEIMFRGYDDDTPSLEFIICGAPTCTIVFGSIGPVSADQKIKIYDCEPEEFEEMVEEALGGKESEAAKACYMSFDAIKFNRHAHTCWNIKGWEPDWR